MFSPSRWGGFPFRAPRRSAGSPTPRPAPGTWPGGCPFRDRPSGGFTLIETVLSLVVIGIGLFGMMTLYSSISYQMYHADLQVIGAGFAQQRVEQIVATKAAAGYAAVTTQPNETLTDGPYTFTRATVVEYINPNTMAPSGNDTGYKRVTVSVTWAGGAGPVTVTTLVTNQVPL